MRNDRMVRFGVMAMLALLCLQFLEGMLVNFYVELPAGHPGAHPPHYFWGVVHGVMWALFGSRLALLVVHVALGLLLALLSLLLVVLSFLARSRVWIIASLVGWVGVFAAGFNGASFLDFGHDFSSLLMSVGFVIALLSYGTGAYLAR